MASPTSLYPGAPALPYSTAPLIDLEALNPEDALEREWLCANGLGGYAMGTLAGANTRRYHGLLVAALAPPLGRTVLCAKVDETFDRGDGPVALGANEFRDGTRFPWGVAHLHAFRLEGARPTWRYRVPGGFVERSIWMEHGRSTTYLRYTAGGSGGRLRLAVFANYKDYHHETQGSPEWRFSVAPQDGGARISAFPGATPWRIFGPPGARFDPAGDWWWHFRHRRECERGLDCEEDLYLVGYLEFPLAIGRPAAVVITSEPEGSRGARSPDDDPDAAWERQRARERRLIQRAGAEDDPLRAQLVLAADQFLVQRTNGVPGETGAILAGYPWFSDWGRDTMIALPGLTLTTGRHSEARHILAAYARFIDRGMLPNRFPDSGQEPQYNTVDAALWYFQAIGAYVAATEDLTLVEELFPALEEILSWHLSGTRYGIAVDTNDGLLRAGQEGTQLTWMDAKVHDWVVTPRHGKPVEINALWHSALRHMDEWAQRLSRPTEITARPGISFSDLAGQVRASFNARFWHGQGLYLYDVLDTPSGTADSALRPNQLFALSLPYPVLDRRRFQSVLNCVQKRLLTPVGVRTLAPGSPDYRGRYSGDPWSRDGAYHQGTAWAWLLGAYVDGRRALGAPVAELHALCRPLTVHLSQAGVGSISEVFDGDWPHTPGGCPAQAWSVAELLRSLSPFHTKTPFPPTPA